MNWINDVNCLAVMIMLINYLGLVGWQPLVGTLALYWTLLVMMCWLKVLVMGWGGPGSSLMLSWVAPPLCGLLWLCGYISGQSLLDFQCSLLLTN
jgi:hypothetical protein